MELALEKQLNSGGRQEVFYLHRQAHSPSSLRHNGHSSWLRVIADHPAAILHEKSKVTSKIHEIGYSNSAPPISNYQAQPQSFAESYHDKDIARQSRATRTYSPRVAYTPDPRELGPT